MGRGRGEQVPGILAATLGFVVAVRDPTDEGQQPRGKQVRRPRSIWYTAVTGIWQTVWLETVPSWHVSGLRIDWRRPAIAVAMELTARGARPVFGQAFRAAARLGLGTQQCREEASSEGATAAAPI